MRSDGGKKARQRKGEGRKGGGEKGREEVRGDGG